MNGDTALVFDNQNQGILNTLLDRILVAYKGDKSFVNAAAYCSDGWDVSNRLHIDAGGRVEYSRADHITSVSPRLTVKYNVSEKNEILGSLGLYTQNNYDLDVIALSDNLKPEKVWHAAAGLETKLLPWLTQKIDVYGKYYYDLASEIIEQKEVSFPNPLDIESPVYNPEENYLDSLNHTEIISIGFPGRYSIYQSYYTNEGKGTAFGFEYMLRFDPTDFWHGWLSFTWGKSVRWRREGWRKHPFPLDRPLLISVNNYYRLPRKYEISLKYRYQSGIPYTSVKSVQDQVFIGNFNDNRYVGYQRFDIRFSKGFSVKSVKGNFYTEIWNAFNSPNLFGLDSKSRDLVTIVPNLPVTMLYAGVECVF
jgi:outer membrane receptor protein involved in Fe transport